MGVKYHNHITQQMRDNAQGKIIRCDVCGEIYSEWYDGNRTSIIKFFEQKTINNQEVTEIDCCSKCTTKLLTLVDDIQSSDKNKDASTMVKGFIFKHGILWLGWYVVKHADPSPLYFDDNPYMTLRSESCVPYLTFGFTKSGVMRKMRCYATKHYLKE